MNLWLVLPDGQEYAYGPVPDGCAPLVGEHVRFTREDPEGKLVPDEGLEGARWMVLGREWTIRNRPYPHERIVFLTLRLAPTSVVPSA